MKLSHSFLYSIHQYTNNGINMNQSAFNHFISKHPEALATIPLENIPQDFDPSRNSKWADYLVTRSDLTESLLNILMCYGNESRTKILSEKYPSLRKSHFIELLFRGAITDFTKEELIHYLDTTTYFHFTPKLVKNADDEVYQLILDKIALDSRTENREHYLRECNYIPQHLVNEYFTKIPELIKYIDSPTKEQILYAANTCASYIFSLIQPSAIESLEEDFRNELLIKYIYPNTSYSINFFYRNPPNEKQFQHFVDNTRYYNRSIYLDILKQCKFYSTQAEINFFLSKPPTFEFVTNGDVGFFTEEILMSSIKKHGAHPMKHAIEHQLMFNKEFKKFLDKFPNLLTHLDNQIEEEYKQLCEKYLPR